MINYKNYNLKDNLELNELLNDIVIETEKKYNIIDNDYNFYGDCYPWEVLELKNKIMFAKNESYIELYIQDIISIFESYAKSFIENE